MSHIPKESQEIKPAEEPSLWPVAVDEERSALGAFLLGRAAEAVKIFSSDLFGLRAHREIFAAICALVEAGEAANGASIEFAALASELAARGKLVEVGGLATITDLTTGCCASRPLQSRLRRLREFAARRQILRLSQELERRAVDLGCDVKTTNNFLQEQATR